MHANKDFRVFMTGQSSFKYVENENSKFELSFSVVVLVLGHCHARACQHSVTHLAKCARVRYCKDGGDGKGVDRVMCE